MTAPGGADGGFFRERVADLADRIGTLRKFMIVVVPEVDPNMSARMSDALQAGDLTELGASYAFTKLWTRRE